MADEEDINVDPRVLKERRDKWVKHSKCEEMKNNAFEHCPIVRFLIENIEARGCKMNFNFFECRPCPPNKEINGGFARATETEDPKIVLCDEIMDTQQRVNTTMAHELIHAFDDCTREADWSHPYHIACSEIRASSLSHECNLMAEVRRGALGLDVKAHHQKCVRRRAELSVSMNEACKNEDPKEVVDAVFNSCYQDTAPFDRIP